jgi:hypothetical protein
MGESASVALVPGVAPTGDFAEVKTEFEERGLMFAGGAEHSGGEIIRGGYYSVELEDGFGGTVLVEQSSSTCISDTKFR